MQLGEQMPDTQLAKQMYKLAEGHPRDTELREKADAFDAAVLLMEKDPNIGKFMKAWAQARELWCELTGEPLV